MNKYKREREREGSGGLEARAPATSGCQAATGAHVFPSVFDDALAGEFQIALSSAEDYSAQSAVQSAEQK